MKDTRNGQAVIRTLARTRMFAKARNLIQPGIGSDGMTMSRSSNRTSGASAMPASKATSGSW